MSQNNSSLNLRYYDKTGKSDFIFYMFIVYI